MCDRRDITALSNGTSLFVLPKFAAFTLSAGYWRYYMFLYDSYKSFLCDFGFISAVELSLRVHVMFVLFTFSHTKEY